MGTTQSTARSANFGTTYNSHTHKGRSSFSKEQRHHYPQYNSQHLQPPSSASYSYHGHPQYSTHHKKQSCSNLNYGSSPPSSHTSQSSSLQRAFGRRRSSNQTVESLPSSLGSSASFHQSDMNQPRHSGETYCGQRSEDQESRWINGRRYHNSSSLYMLPNDTEEVDRLHLQHYIFKMIMGGKNIHVPIPKDNGMVADLGCGPATWTMDMATELTSVNFVGVDISPIYPQAIHPRNCSFYKEDILNGISQPDKSFDVVYQRNVSIGFTAENWKRSIQEAYRLLKPGGWFESVESDVSVQEAGPFTNMCFENMRLSMAPRNIDPSIVRSLDRLMVSAGFVDVQVKEYCVPLGEWGGKMGQLWKQNVMSVLETVKPHLAKAGRITDSQVSDMVQNMAKETQEYRSYQTIYVTLGRKPVS